MKDSFIFLFKTPCSFYFYDVNKNETVPISEELYENLMQEKITGKDIDDIPEKTKKEKSYLVGKGYLSGRRASEICHPAEHYLGDIVGRSMKELILQITQKCNFQCKYCAYSPHQNERQRNHSNRSMELWIAKRAIDFFLEHSIDQEEVTFAFYGGEPLLEFENMKCIVSYIEKRFKGKKVKYTITTNGSIFNDEICSFLQEKNFDVMISIDGTKDSHDKNRVFASNKCGTYEAILKNIIYVKNNFDELGKRLSINMVVDTTAKDVVCRSEQIMGGKFSDEYIHVSGIDTLYLDQSEYTKDEMKKRVRYDYHTFWTFLMMMGEYPRDEISLLSRNAVKSSVNNYLDNKNAMPITFKSCPSGPCVPGEDRFFVTVDGRFFPCERVSEKSEALCIGNVFEGYDYKKARQLLNIARLTEENCKNCVAFKKCTVCARICDNGKQLETEKKLEHCKEVLVDFETSIRIEALMKDISRVYKKKIDPLNI